MANKKPQDQKEPLKTLPEFTLSSAGQITVTYSTKLTKGPSNKLIHPRRRLPDVPEAPPKRDQK